jgi:Trypsin-co-occurring domain 1
VVEAVKFPLESGGEVLVRVDSSDQHGGVVTRGGREHIQGAIEQAGQSFESALSTIRLVAEAVLSQLADVASAPEEVRVEFGLELSAKAGAVLAAAGAGAPTSRRADLEPQGVRQRQARAPARHGTVPAHGWLPMTDRGSDRRPAPTRLWYRSCSCATEIKHQLELVTVMWGRC